MCRAFEDPPVQIQFQQPTMDELLKKVDHILDDDLYRFKLINRENENDRAANKKKRKNDEFVKYLVSVATHPIGLPASVNPFNSCQEHMLAYLMEMFKLSDNKIKKMLLAGNETGAAISRGKKIDKIEEPSVASARKRHSWRPELRVRLNAPTFYKSADYLSNLSVRVYLFKEEQVVAFGADNTNQLPATTHKTPENRQDTVVSDQTDVRSRGILNKIFKRFQLNPSILIRPVNEMRCLLKFRPPESSSEVSQTTRVSHKLVQVVDGKTTMVDDVYLQIRRYYCEPGTNHILRFEFWLDTQHIKSTFMKRFRHLARRLVYNGGSCCCRAGNRSTYMNEQQELYGFINIKMIQLPSYPIKQNYPVLTLHERKVNNCEVSLDIRNRRIQAENKFQLITEENSRNDKLEDNHILSHLRLYANTMLYQCLNLSQSSFSSLTRDETHQNNITIENLLYLPAYSLINQHRLQSNLSRFEDQSLRRISFLLSLIKLNQYSSDTPDAERKFNGLMILLISVLQNEYMAAHRTIDDRTMQEIDPFGDAAHSNVIKLELTTLEKFIKSFLPGRLKEWILHAASKRSKHKLRLSITLHSLRMFKLAISNLKKCISIRRLMRQLQTDVLHLKSLVNQLLCEMILVHISTNIESIAYLDSRTLEKQKRGGLKVSIPAILTNQDGDSLWAQLLYKINCVDHDLSLFWSRRGLDGLITSQMEFVKNLNVFESLERRNFRRVVEDKIDNYLR